MISRIARLRAKKGFTIIEIVVVLAIIGVLTSIIVSALSYNQKPIVGRGIAKDVYYIAQDNASTSKITEPLAMDTALNPAGSTGTYAKFGVYISLDPQGEIIDRDTGEIKDWGTMYIAADNTGAMPAVAQVQKGICTVSGSDAAERKAQLNKMTHRILDAMVNYLESTDNMDGTIIVLIDENYRVLGAYWTEIKTTIIDASTLETKFLIDGTGMFTDTNLLENGYYCSAYPVKDSVAGRYMYNTN